jgi:LPS-assembly protein
LKTVKYNKRLFGCLLLIVLALSAKVDARDIAGKLPRAITTYGTGNEATRIQADRAEYELDSGWVTFAGNVAIKYKDVELRSDRIRYNQKTGDAQALGQVVLVSDDGSIWRGSALDINIRDLAGKIETIDIYTSPFRVLAETGTISKKDTYEVHNATITTCTNEPGRFHWQMSTRRARVRSGDDVTAWGGVPRFFGVPLFYFPYFWKDLSRHYGFRFEPGYQSSWGVYLLSTYKFPIIRDKVNENYLDSRTSLDYRTKRGIAYGERLNWETRDFGEGWFSAYFADDDKPPIGIEDTDRYRLRFNHDWNATYRDQLLMQAIYVSDDLFMHDFFRREFRNMNQPDNYISFTHLGDIYSAGLLTRFRLNDFYTQVERLPEAWFNLNSLEIGNTGFYIENKSALGYLNKEYDERYNPMPESYSSVRFDSLTTMSKPMKFFGFLNLNPRAGYRATYYSKTLDKITQSTTSEIITTNEYGDVESVYSTTNETLEYEDGSDFRSVLEFGMEASLKAFGHWRDESGNIWRHIVEPYANYTFIPEPNILPDELYQFDDVDSINKQHFVRLGVRNRWQVRQQESSRIYERLYMNFFAEINLDPEEGFDNIDRLYFETRYRPNTWMRFDFESWYDAQESELESASIRLMAWHNVFNTDVEFRYRNDNSSLLLGNLTWRINQPWSINVFGRYEFEGSQVEEIGSWIQHKWDCMAIRLYLSVEPGHGERRDGSPEKDDYKISIAGWLTDFPLDSIRERDYR